MDFKCNYCHTTQPLINFKQYNLGGYSCCCNECKIKRHNTYLLNSIKIKEKRNNQEFKDRVKRYNQNYHNTQKLKNTNYLIEKKLCTYRVSDKTANRLYNENEYITREWILKKLKKSNNKCKYCNETLELLNHEGIKNSKLIFSVDRLCNKLPHIKSNCVICCWHCNFLKH